MPVIICPKCKSEYEVPLSTMGKTVRCKRCGRSFEARVLRSQRHENWKVKPITLLVSLLGVGLFVILGLIVHSSLSKTEGPPPELRDFSPPAGRQESGTDAENLPSGKETAPSPERTERERFCLDFLRAVEENDTDKLQHMFNFPAFHRIHKKAGDPSLDELEEVDRVLKKKEYLEALTDDTDGGGGFLRKSEVREVSELSWNGEEGEVEVKLENPHNGRLQERRLRLRAVGSRLTVYDCETGPVHGGDLERKPSKTVTLEEKYRRRVSPLGEIQRVSYTEDTDEAEAERIQGLVQDLLGENRLRVRSARQALRKLGKRAVPGLLNALVGLDMTRIEDVSRANTCTSMLRDLTGMNFHFIPGFIEESRLDSVSADLEASLRRWFGWWDNNKDRWDGKPVREPEGTGNKP